MLCTPMQEQACMSSSTTHRPPSSASLSSSAFLNIKKRPLPPSLPLSFLSSKSFNFLELSLVIRAFAIVFQELCSVFPLYRPFEFSNYHCRWSTLPIAQALLARAYMLACL